MEQVAEPSSDEPCGVYLPLELSKVYHRDSYCGRAAALSRAEPVVAGFVINERNTGSEGWLIRFRFRRAVLVAHLVLFEQFFHLFGDHVAIVRDRDERDFFASLGLLRLFGGLRLLRALTHG
jgi:hypothetical protein